MINGKWWLAREEHESFNANHHFSSHVIVMRISQVRQSQVTRSRVVPVLR